jgi:hypothetical protein
MPSSFGDPEGKSTGFEICVNADSMIGMSGHKTTKGDMPLKRSNSYLDL